jgi:hypothetical protein
MDGALRRPPPAPAPPLPRPRPGAVKSCHNTQCSHHKQSTTQQYACNLSATGKMLVLCSEAHTMCFQSCDVPVVVDTSILTCIDVALPARQCVATAVQQQQQQQQQQQHHQTQRCECKTDTAAQTRAVGRVGVEDKEQTPPQLVNEWWLSSAQRRVGCLRSAINSNCSAARPYCWHTNNHFVHMVGCMPLSIEVVC